MKKLILIVMLVAGLARYTETIHGIYYPNAYEVEDFTDMGLEMLEGGK